jgi:hypothetical protein
LEHNDEAAKMANEDQDLNNTLAYIYQQQNHLETIDRTIYHRPLNEMQNLPIKAKAAWIKRTQQTIARGRRCANKQMRQKNHKITHYFRISTPKKKTETANQAVLVRTTADTENPVLKNEEGTGTSTNTSNTNTQGDTQSTPKKKCTRRAETPIVLNRTSTKEKSTDTRESKNRKSTPRTRSLQRFRRNPKTQKENLDPP